MNALYLFRNDLRLADNPGLAALTDADSLLCLYCWPELPPWCNLAGMGPQRERFLRESLLALRRELRAQDQDLMILSADPRIAIPKLVEHLGIERVATQAATGYYEAQQLEALAAIPGVTVDITENASLLESSQLPGELARMPRQFTPFRKAVEALAVPEPAASPTLLPPPPGDLKFRDLPTASVSPHTAFPIRGGSGEGQRRLRQWMFERKSVANYKQTRDYLDGLEGSSVLSPWLASGSLSPREVAHALFAFEEEHGRNESTTHLYSELLWREFFHWRAQVDGIDLFMPGGISGRKQLRSFDARDFARWCQGDTDSPLVNALMHQLVATGWMSNRGRQIAASYLVNEYNHDWRYGAAFFEKHLVDFDVGSNYGNWQYIAGVGTDPRGGRHFDIDTQATLYDPDGTFTAKWDGYRARQPRYINDAADWPLEDG